MMLRSLLAFALVVILGVPFALRLALHEDSRTDEGRTLVVYTPHVRQITDEFSRAFDEWHRRQYGEPAHLDVRRPGGTSEIIRQLKDQFRSAFEQGRVDPVTFECEPGAIDADVLFGGGSYDHGRLVDDLRVTHEGEQRTIPMSTPPSPRFEQERLDEWYGENRIGASVLHDPDQHWFGTALSSFGIVYNRDLVAELGVGEPGTFEDMTDPRLAGWVALADPRQSGSITTTFDSILASRGWDEGWALLREMTANTRYFTNMSTKPPLDVSQGEAAMGLAIDFYGRGQAQAVLRAGQDPSESRVGYSDPSPVFIDPDPVSIIRGGPSPDLARRFVEFCMTIEAQSLWQFPARDRAENPTLDGVLLGPAEYELRRLPIRRVMYDRYLEHFVDQVDPWTIAADVATRGWRTGIGMMMGAFAVDTAEQQRRAWEALASAREDPEFAADVLAEMEALFYAFPTTGIEGERVPFTEETYRTVRNVWRVPETEAALRLEYTDFFRETYERVVTLARKGR